ncbi:MAG TPA: sialidase family protein [Polyangia bacterium]|nr:sialidase family protein [Polyangia bacterium]
MFALTSSKLACAVALLTLLTGAGRALANGALPASYGILLPADKPEEVVLATNFGMIISDDGGKSWLWTCERPETSFGYLYGVGPAPRDRFYALSPDAGLAFSDDGSCTWQTAGGALSGLVASDFFVDRTNADRVLAVAASVDADSGDIGPPSVFSSTDGGATFLATPLYTAPTGAIIVSIEIARKNPMVIYVAMYTTPDRHPRLLRSDDGGQTWMDRDVEPGLGANEFRILTVDPDDADVLYLRVVAPGMEMVAVTRDAGATFTTPVTVAKGSLSAFARLASGTVLVGALINLDGGGMNGTAYRSTDGGKTFGPWTLSPQPHILGLAERDGVLYIAGKNYSDGWALSTSHDEGATIQTLSTYGDVHGIKPCAKAMCGDQCTLVAMQAVWTNDVCTWTPQMTPPPGSNSGCHCAAGEAAGGAAAVWALLGAVVAIHCRRRRR